MGRGLSDLQREILRLAYRNHVDEGRRLTRWALDVVLDDPARWAVLGVAGGVS